MKLFVRRVGHSWDSNVSEYDNMIQSLNTIYNYVISYLRHDVNTIESMFSLYTKIQMIQIYPITAITVSLIKIDIRKQTTLHAVTLFVHEASDLN